MPVGVRLAEAGELRPNPVPLEQSATSRLVRSSRLLEFFGVDDLARVMEDRTEQNCVSIQLEGRKT